MAKKLSELVADLEAAAATSEQLTADRDAAHARFTAADAKLSAHLGVVDAIKADVRTAVDALTGGGRVR